MNRILGYQGKCICSTGTNRKVLFTLLSLIFFLLLSFRVADSFREAQIRNSRVRAAFEEKLGTLTNLLLARGIDPESFELYLRAFKMEGIVEVWGRTKGSKEYQKVVEYPFCENVGFPGPKRRKGDGQIPEGMYQLESFNPVSNYHLSLKLNYPNQADRNREGDYDLGGLIYIHGGCASIGCIPITDDKIRELYVLAVLAKDQGQSEIEVHIFPNSLSRERFQQLANNTNDKELVKFWGNLRTSIVFFNRFKYPPAYSIDQKGVYHFRHP